MSKVESTGLLTLPGFLEVKHIVVTLGDMGQGVVPSCCLLS